MLFGTALLDDPCSVGLADSFADARWGMPAKMQYQCRGAEELHRRRHAGREQGCEEHGVEREPDRGKQPRRARLKD
jgi:hypothetical protein